MSKFEIAGRFNEDLVYTVHGKPLTHPIWAPAKPDPRWTITTKNAFTEAEATHPNYPSVIFRWDSKYDYISAKIQWQDGPVYVESSPHICPLPQLFNEFMYSMMKAAEEPIHKFPNDKIITY